MRGLGENGFASCRVLEDGVYGAVLVEDILVVLLELRF